MSFLRKSKIQAKSHDEIIKMRAAGLVVGLTLELVRQSVKPGMSTAELDALGEDSIRSSGATPSFLGYYGFKGSLCLSVNEEIVHGVPGSRELVAGDLLSIDCGAIVDGWHGDAAISLIVGGRDAASEQDLALMDDTEKSLWAGISAMRAGGRLHAIGEEVEASVLVSQAARQAAGMDLAYGVIEDFVGHGIGREMHMDPNVPNYAVAGKSPMIPSGATLAIEPMVTLGTIESKTLSDEWTVITADNSRAAHWEHSVAVTDAGLWVLTAVDGGAAKLAEFDADFAPLAD
ncbi:type I methionyl aminopeptidase [Ornithinimicrobium sp. Arc0846-15]|nr:type I methionyl aminopeptidase [Ornithinimicrobium laminariae]